ncbi:MAG: pyrimidine 5'-nucleotidase [Thermodesulfobacteriota bacterium]|nr:pyrimidine 5'-nucleotidase [Thermodesulfobacteriota bacterium]
MKRLLVDIDDTLYPKGAGPFAHVSARIDAYVKERLRMGPARARRLRRSYVRRYGSTLKGLMIHHDVDPHPFLQEVHDVPVEEMLHVDEGLVQTLSSLECGLTAFSNASLDYAGRVLRALGIDEFFDDLFTIEYMDFIPKPLEYPYLKVMEFYGQSPEGFIMVDDRIANVETAIAIGMEGVVVGDGAPDTLSCPYVPDIYGIRDVISEKGVKK